MSAAGDKAATATDDHWVQIWDLPSGRLSFDMAVSWRSPVGRAGLHAPSTCGESVRMLHAASTERHAVRGAWCMWRMHVACLGVSCMRPM